MRLQTPEHKYAATKFAFRMLHFWHLIEYIKSISEIHKHTSAAYKVEAPLKFLSAFFRKILITLILLPKICKLRLIVTLFLGL